MHVATAQGQRSDPASTKLPVGCITFEPGNVQTVSTLCLEEIGVPLISLLAFWRSHGPVHPHQMECLETVWVQGIFL